MLEKKLLGENGITARNALISIVLIGNTIAWYFSAFNFVSSMITDFELTYAETLITWSLNFVGGSISAIIGTQIIKKVRWVQFISLWMLLGTVSSIIPIIYFGKAVLFIASLLFGVSFGLGLPICMRYYAECTATEIRARFGGILFFLSGLGITSIMAIESVNIVPNVLILAIWRAAGLIFFLLLKPPQRLEDQSKTVSFVSILKSRHFLFYFAPWILFSLVSYLSMPVLFDAFGEDSILLLNTVESVLAACFAVVIGFFSDYFGRKRMVIAGFIMFGIGYAILGINPSELGFWYFYIAIDGIAWGIFYTLFIFTLWGDLSYGLASDKYYALGGQPFFLSNFVRFVLAPYIAGAVPDYALFSFASFFLFLAVIPLMYAPETLPEKKIRERELKIYIEKAQKIKEKYS